MLRSSGTGVVKKERAARRGPTCGDAGSVAAMMARAPRAPDRGTTGPSMPLVGNGKDYAMLLSPGHVVSNQMLKKTADGCHGAMTSRPRIAPGFGMINEGQRASA